VGAGACGAEPCGACACGVCACGVCACGPGTWWHRLRPGCRWDTAGRSRGQAGLRARGGPRPWPPRPGPPAGPEVPERQDCWAAGVPACPGRSCCAGSGGRRAASPASCGPAGRRMRPSSCEPPRFWPGKSSPAWTQPPGAPGRRGSSSLSAGWRPASRSLGSGGHQTHRLSSNPGPTAVVNRDPRGGLGRAPGQPGHHGVLRPGDVRPDRVSRVPRQSCADPGPGEGQPARFECRRGHACPSGVSSAPSSPRCMRPGLLATFGSGSRQVGHSAHRPRMGRPPTAPRSTPICRTGGNPEPGCLGATGSRPPFTARNQLAAGQVDSRLMITLALMASLHPGASRDLRRRRARTPTRPRFRSAELSVTGSAQKKAVLSFLRPAAAALPARARHDQAHERGPGPS